eukprot:1156859-Pelagomonas_calceolata.AAC.3
MFRHDGALTHCHQLPQSRRIPAFWTTACTANIRIQPSTRLITMDGSQENKEEKPCSPIVCQQGDSFHTSELAG